MHTIDSDEVGEQEAGTWLVSMPKIELHAHLNGSIRNSTLLDLARELGEKNRIIFSEMIVACPRYSNFLMSLQWSQRIMKLLPGSLKRCDIRLPPHPFFLHIFSFGILFSRTSQVIEDFAEDNVVYLELRTTPKRNDLVEMTKRSYVEAVLKGISAVSSVDVNVTSVLVDAANALPLSSSCSKSMRKKIYVRLLLSIDRRETMEAALETVNLALEMRNVGVVGVDLSGNPSIGHWETYLPALNLAKENGLPITLHCGEVPNHDEIKAMLDFGPNRIGHACCFEDAEWNLLKSSKIPVEICLTSNIRTETIASLDIHHFVDLYHGGHPLILCTDDSGVFSTSLSKEYIAASSTFGLGKKELFKLARSGVELVFAEDEVKQNLSVIFRSAAKEFDQ